MGRFQIVWVYYGILIESRPVIVWNVIVGRHQLRYGWLLFSFCPLNEERNDKRLARVREKIAGSLFRQ